MQSRDESALKLQASLGLSDLCVIEVQLLAQFRHVAPMPALPQHQRRANR
jgi:hypothetical protein